MTGSPPSGLRAFLLICVLALLSIFPPLATDMYLAAMGDIAGALDASHAAAELSLSVFFLGLCVGQLIFGPLIDAYGRKLPLVGGTVLFTMTSVGLLLTDNVVIFNGLRFLQALGACAGMVVGRAVVMDLYDGRKAARVLTILVMLMTLGPILSPTLGSILLVSFGWQSIFVALVVVGAAALVLVMLVVPETLPADGRKERALTGALRHYGVLACRIRFLLPTMVTALVQAPMFAFITASSGVFQGSFGLSSLAYGLLFGLIASSLVIFGQINSWLLHRYEPAQILSAGLPVLVLSSAVLLIVSGTDTIWFLVAPLWVSLGLVGLLSANVMTIAMEGSPEAAGIGSAGIGAVQFAFAFATSTVVALAGTGSAAPMAAAIFLCALAGSGLWAGFGRRLAADPEWEAGAS